MILTILRPELLIKFSLNTGTRGPDYNASVTSYSKG